MMISIQHSFQKVLIIGDVHHRIGHYYQSQIELKRALGIEQLKTDSRPGLVLEESWLQLDFAYSIQFSVDQTSKS